MPATQAPTNICTPDIKVPSSAVQHSSSSNTAQKEPFVFWMTSSNDKANIMAAWNKVISNAQNMGQSL
jgi:hypothetical protein